MTDNCEIEVEVGESVGISNGDETVTESRKDSIAKDESAQKKSSKRRAIEKTFVWKIFKNIVFLICLIFLVIQSVEFFNAYYEYPTNIVLKITVAKEFKLPAITVCFKNTISFKEFCLYEPDHCEKPSNMGEFCRKYPIHCEEDNSSLKVPVQDYETRKVMQHYLLNDSYNDAALFRRYRYTKVRTFVKDFEDVRLILKCYSENLHLYQSRSKPETRKLYFNNIEGDLFHWTVLDQMNIEPFYPKDEPQVFFTIHSPYVPIDPMKLHAIRPGKRYRTEVQLEKEEHLLPPPYQTNCRDNGPSKDAKEFTNPNSYEMCLELCRSESDKAVDGCYWGMTMIPTVRDLCYGDRKRPNPSSEQRDELTKKRLLCFQNCKQGCLKLHYKHTIREIGYKNPEYRNRSYIHLYVKNPEVTVLRHVPLYGSGDIFSHIGGLLGCWLGISVFTFTNIMEKFFRKVVIWKRRIRNRRFRKRRCRKRKEQRAPTSEIHQD